MIEDQAKTWVKDKKNQDTVVRELFSKYNPVASRVAVFMAGIPGAGKTEYVEKIIQVAAMQMLPIEHDKIVERIEGYVPENYYHFRKAGSVLVTRILSDSLKFGYSFIFDGTLSSERAARNIRQTISAGYVVIIIYLVQDPATAWEITQARELIKKRAIERTGFLDTCDKISSRLLAIFRAHKDSPQFQFILIDKQGASDMKQATAIIHSTDADSATEIEKKLKIPYNI